MYGSRCSRVCRAEAIGRRRSTKLRSLTQLLSLSLLLLTILLLWLSLLYLRVELCVVISMRRLFSEMIHVHHNACQQVKKNRGKREAHWLTKCLPRESLDRVGVFVTLFENFSSFATFSLRSPLARRAGCCRSEPFQLGVVDDAAVSHAVRSAATHSSCQNNSFGE